MLTGPSSRGGEYRFFVPLSLCAMQMRGSVILSCPLDDGTSAVSANGAASEPLTFVRHPPADNRYGNGGGERPPERQDEIGDQAEQNEHDPEDLALHQSILSSSRASENARE